MRIFLACIVLILSSCASVSGGVFQEIVSTDDSGSTVIRIYTEPCQNPKVLWQIKATPFHPHAANMNRATVTVLPDNITWEACSLELKKLHQWAVIDESGWIGYPPMPPEAPKTSS